MEIYALSDDIGAIRYIGWAYDSAQRLKKHLEPAQLKLTTHKNVWIKSLLAHGLKPEVQVIQKLNTLEDAKAAEIYWIAFFKGQGCNLTNGTEGGDGGATYGHLGHKHTDEAKARISAAKTGVKNPLANASSRMPIVDSTGKVFESVRAASRELNLERTGIIRVLKGLKPKHDGLSFNYVEKHEELQ